ncbi:MAG: YdcF family protein [Bacteroidales bacterium]|nr:YdcF family protein [Bacteroidales bacterium]
MNKKIKVASFLIISLFVLMMIVILVCDVLVTNSAKGKIHDNIEDVEATDYGLLLGTTPITRIGNRENLFFRYRIEATVNLYRNGKIKKVLVSGAEKSLNGIDETQSMKQALVAQGVPSDIIILDGQGYRTIESVVRMNKVYGIKSCVIISQQFHNERALYLAEHLDLDIENLQAYNAVSPSAEIALMTYVREYLARVKMFMDIFLNKYRMIGANSL